MDEMIKKKNVKIIAAKWCRTKRIKCTRVTEVREMGPRATRRYVREPYRNTRISIWNERRRKTKPLDRESRRRKPFVLLKIGQRYAIAFIFITIHTLHDFCEYIVVISIYEL